MSLAFEWDNNKAKQNLKKHGVPFEEASTVYADPLARTILDPLHLGEEDRFVLLGGSRGRRLLVVVFTERGSRIRIILVRRAERHEHDRYYREHGS